MAYPYVASGGPLLKTIEQLRKSFPKEVKAETLRKLGVAPKNETYVMNVLRFLGVIDDEGRKVDEKSKPFIQHKEEDFAKEFEKIVRPAYKELFDLHGNEAWALDKASLTQFFRTSDSSSEVVGTRQAVTFMNLAALAGHANLPATRDRAEAGRPRPRKVSQVPRAVVKGARSKPGTESPAQQERGEGTRNLGLTVRIEVNLPAEADQETYDRIFRSIRENLINAK